MSTSSSDRPVLARSSPMLGDSGQLPPLRLLLRALRELVPLSIALVVILGGLELLLRGFDDFGYNGPELYRDAQVDEHTLIHHGRLWHQREFATRVRLNQDGYYAHPFAAIEARPHRIAVIGDSFVFAEQMEIDAGFTMRAQAGLDSVQILSMGKPGYYAPNYAQMLREEIPRLFGPAGVHPRIEGVVFCVRVWGGLGLAQGGRGYPVTEPTMSWNWRSKRPVFKRAQMQARRFLISRSHAMSLVSTKIDEWLRLDMDKEKHALTPATIDIAAQTLQDEVFTLIVAEAARQGISVAVLYLPTAGEYEGYSPPIHARMKARLLESLDEVGIPWVDAADHLPAGQPLFYEHDRHPNIAGHDALSKALIEVVEAMGATR